MSGRSAVGKLLVLTVILLVGVPFVMRLSLLETRGFNPDELQHLHYSWNVSRGLVPYRDYFDHHTPGLHFFFASLLGFYDVERDPEDAIAFILMARRWMWLCAGITLALTFFLGRSWRDATKGLLATVLLANTGFFLAKSLEVRPAVPAAALLVGAVYLALAGVRRAIDGERGAGARLLGSGLALGVATMITQKVLFVGPGFALVTIWLLLDGRLPLSRARRLRLTAVQVLGFVVPVALTLAYFASRGALSDFIECNIFATATWPGLSAGPFLVELVRQDAAYVVLVCAGFLAGAGSAFRLDEARRGEPVVMLPTLSLVATLPLHPAMSYQHFLLILPMTSLYAGTGLLGAAALVSRLGMRVVSWSRWREALLLVAVLLLSIQPLTRYRETFGRGNWGTLEGIRYVLRNTAPWETTLDGFTGLGLFRPQAFYHGFIHPHIFVMQTPAERTEIFEALASGRAQPKLLFWSHYLREALIPEAIDFVTRHYVPTGVEPILIRPFDNGLGWWSDVEPRYLGWDPEHSVRGERMPHVMFDDGWRVPTNEFGAPVRRTRTRSSKLIVPIRQPRDFTAVFRAHADREEAPFAVELVVNGHGCGVVEAAPRWQDYEFFVSVRHLRPGFNEFELRFSAENDLPERRLELAVNYLKLVPDVVRADP